MDCLKLMPSIQKTEKFVNGQQSTILSSSMCNGPMIGFYPNGRGLRSKLFNFNCNVSSVNCIFIILTETWLTDNFLNFELDLVQWFLN